MKKVTLYYNGSRGVWTHDASGHSFIGWDEPESEANSFAKVQASAKKQLATYFSGLPGHGTVTADDIEIDWKQAPNRNPPPPVEVRLTNFQQARSELAPDANPAAAGLPRERPPPERHSPA